MSASFTMLAISCWTPNLLGLAAAAGFSCRAWREGGVSVVSVSGVSVVPNIETLLA